MYIFFQITFEGNLRQTNGVAEVSLFFQGNDTENVLLVKVAPLIGSTDDVISGHLEFHEIEEQKQEKTKQPEVVEPKGNFCSSKKTKVHPTVKPGTPTDSIKRNQFLKQKVNIPLKHCKCFTTVVELTT